RQPVRDVVPVLLRLARCALRRGARQRRLAASRARLPTAAALGDGAQVHGGVRDVGRAAARPDTRTCGGTVARAAGGPLPAERRVTRARRDASAPKPAAPERAVAAFRQAYGRDPTHLAHAPGRVNLIGEHTDYNDGFVLPMALERATWMAVAARQDGVVRLAADDLGRDGTFTIESARSVDQRGREGGARGRVRTGWIEYPRGVAWSLQDAGIPLRGFDGALASDVPRGAGLSSSAAVELVTAASFAVSSGF